MRLRYELRILVRKSAEKLPEKAPQQRVAASACNAEFDEELGLRIRGGLDDSQDIHTFF